MLGLSAGCGDDGVGGGGSDDSGTSSSTGAVDPTNGPMTTAVDSTGGQMTAEGSGSTGGDSTTAAVDDSTSTGPACFDNDADGVTDCDGDCADDDPTVYPGAAEICGDGVDNACGADPDPMALCMGLGTWVSALTGDDATGDGTQLAPVQTISAGMANAQIIGGGMPVFVAEGGYDEKVIMIEGIDLLGGYQCDAASCTWARDPATYDSTIGNVDLEGVLIGDTVTRATELDGFVIVAPDTNPPGGVRNSAITVVQGTPTISNNRIFGGTVSCNACGTDGIGLAGPSNDPAGALVVGNVIEAGDSVGTGFANSTGIRLTSFVNPAVVEIRGNEIFGGLGRWTRAINAFAAGPGTLIVDNDIHAGDQFGTDGFTSSFGMIISGQITVDSNRINADPAQAGSCPTAVFWCGGIESEGATATITNNVVFGLTAPKSAAFYMSDGEVPFGEIVLNGNTLDGGNALALANSISTAIGCRTNQGVNAIVGRIRNNILGGGGGINRFGMYEDNQAGSRTCEPEVFDNNDIWFAPSPASIDNAYRRWPSGGPGNLLPTVADVNMLSFANGNLDVDPQLDATWHLAAGSLCIDAGVAAEAPPVDFDGDARPQGAEVDIGADEAL